MVRLPPEDFQRLFEGAPGLFLVLEPTPEFTIVGASDAYLKATMTTREGVIGRGILEAFPGNPDDPEATGVANLSASLHHVRVHKRADTMAVQKYDIPRPAADGGGFEERYWSSCNTPVFSSGGRLAYIIHRVEDVTEYVHLSQSSRRREAHTADLEARNREMESEILRSNVALSTLNAELRETNQRLAGLAEQVREESHRKDEFLAMLAHELRNPLAAMHNIALLLEKGSGDDADARRHIGVLRRQTTNLSALVDDLLDVSRITRGLVELNRERLDVGSIISRAMDATKGMFEERRHQVRVSLPAEPARVWADAVRLEQVVGNLLSNAAKYTAPGGRIEVRVTRRDEGVEVRVRDNGIGMDLHMLERVFDLFEQAQRSLDRAEGGLGIGLTLSRRLVEMHGGRLDAVSDGPGKGSEFVLCLPSAEAEDLAQAPAPLEDIEPVAGKRVLIVDDDKDAAESLAMLLDISGHEVAVARDGPGAMAKLREFEPQVVLLDIGMPGMSGYEVAAKLRQDAHGRLVRLAAVSGYGRDTDVARARQAGFDTHFVKPVDIEALETFIDGRSATDSPEPAGT